jgi:hypothetical protein
MTDIFQYQKKETLFISPDPEGYQAFKINSSLNTFTSSKSKKNIEKITDICMPFSYKLIIIYI